MASNDGKDEQHLMAYWLYKDLAFAVCNTQTIKVQIIAHEVWVSLELRLFLITQAIAQGQFGQHGFIV